MRHVTGVARRLGTEQVLAQPRIHAVRADRDVGRLHRAVVEAEAHLAAGVLDRRELAAEGDGARRHGLGHQRVEIAAMHGQVARAVGLERVIAERDLRHDLGRDAVAAVPEIRMRTHRVQRVLAADAAHDLHHVRAEVDARAEARERRRLLVEPHVVAAALQQRGGGGAAEAGAHDRDTGFASSESPHLSAGGGDGRPRRLVTLKSSVHTAKYSHKQKFSHRIRARRPHQYRSNSWQIKGITLKPPAFLRRCDIQMYTLDFASDPAIARRRCQHRRDAARRQPAAIHSQPRSP